MVTAIVFVQCETGQVHSVAEALVGLDGIAEVYSISGEYDVMAVIRVREYEDLAQLVTERVAKIPGMTRTITQMAVRCYSKHDMEKIWGEMMGE